MLADDGVSEHGGLPPEELAQVIARLAVGIDRGGLINPWNGAPPRVVSS
jgi:hypothetical protein